MKYYASVLTFLLIQTVNATPLFDKCISCHGRKAEGKQSYGAPKLAGQHSWYIKDQLKLFKSKKRKGGRASMMYGVAKKLSDKDIKELAEYLEGLE